ncbi:MAG: methanol utilization protein MoxY [Curvibacter sp.]|nr:methanol utilization protein MoxY [Curvibacter sp.]
MSLRLQINLLIAVLLGLLSALLVGLQVENTRRSVHEEVVGANLVASQLLSRVQWVYGYGGLQGMQEFLQGVGRVRANDISLLDAEGRPLYRSPPSPYKAGREAPAWYARIVSPPLAAREIALPSGRLLLQADPSRAALDGWDELCPLLAAVAAGFVLANAAVYLLVGRALKPLRALLQGLQAMEDGRYQTRLAGMAGREGRLISQAFNRMAQAVQDSAAARRQADEAAQALAANREQARRLHERIEQERGAIARELHDELGQQITAIKSAGMIIRRHLDRQGLPADSALQQSVRLVLGCADAIYAGMHRLVARLRPLALDQQGLAEALQDLQGDWGLSHPEVAVSLQCEGPLEALDGAVCAASFRIVQEAVNNALRHARPRHVEVRLHSDRHQLALQVEDDGQGRLEDLNRPGHFGIAGMRERVRSLGGRLDFRRSRHGGIALRACLPLTHPEEALSCV